MRYLIIIEPTGNGWSAHVPDLPGCVAAGETRDETIELMRGAIEMHLDGMREDGQTVPEPSAQAEFVELQQT
jgi:predicted RNase H-like HicB family nuclease